ncbi:hypothetical protein R0K30_22630, partial [Bacillus sp. SIMBA_154]|uniref:hypothetical protein n=1 Tax=Bacillus sp. SIMBA_154 TaxID=3080859 RepID=UPI00397AE54B
EEFDEELCVGDLLWEQIEVENVVVPRGRWTGSHLVWIGYYARPRGEVGFEGRILANPILASR